jgi:hypothetical protein
MAEESTPTPLAPTATCHGTTLPVILMSTAACVSQQPFFWPEYARTAISSSQQLTAAPAEDPAAALTIPGSQAGMSSVS